MLLWGPCCLLWGGVFCEAASLGFIRLSVSLTDSEVHQAGLECTCAFDAVSGRSTYLLMYPRSQEKLTGQALCQYCSLRRPQEGPLGSPGAMACQSPSPPTSLPSPPPDATPWAHTFVGTVHCASPRYQTSLIFTLRPAYLEGGVFFLKPSDFHIPFKKMKGIHLTHLLSSGLSPGLPTIGSVWTQIPTRQWLLDLFMPTSPTHEGAHWNVRPKSQQPWQP